VAFCFLLALRADAEEFKFVSYGFEAISLSDFGFQFVHAAFVDFDDAGAACAD